jgi:hypothetical protein
MFGNVLTESLEKLICYEVEIVIRIKKIVIGEGRVG